MDYADVNSANGCRSVKVATENIENSSGYVKAVMTISETVKDNTPDYEVFDTLYLSLTVEDLNQEVNLGTDTGGVLFGFNWGFGGVYGFCFSDGYGVYRGCK